MVNSKCDGCGKSMSKPRKTIRTIASTRQLQMNSKLCGRCRMIVYRKGVQPSRSPERGPSASRARLDPSPPQAPPSSSSSDPAEEDDFADTTFTAQTGTETAVEVLEMPFNRVISTERCCFVCGSTEGRLRASPQLREQAFVR